jgi:hypothetical protein
MWQLVFIVIWASGQSSLALAFILKKSGQSNGSPRPTAEKVISAESIPFNLTIPFIQSR